MEDFHYYLLTKYFEAGETGISFKYRQNTIQQSPEYKHLLGSQDDNDAYTKDFLRTILKEQDADNQEIISDKGKDLYHLEYKKREKDEKALKPSFQQKYWWAIGILTFAIGFIGDIGKEAVKKKMWPELQVKKLTPEEIIDSAERLKSKVISQEKDSLNTKNPHVGQVK